MIDLRPILFILGLLLTTLALAMSLPALVDAATGHADWQVFLASAGLTLFVGVSLILTMRGGNMEIGIREAFVLTVGSWLGVTLFASLPFVFAELNLSFADAFFEAMSGITTTGATVIVNLDNAPPGILLWRALLQWLGGIGIIVTAVAMLPMLKVGGMQLFRMESSDTTEKVLPRAAQISTAIGAIYFILTSICAVAYWAAGMPGFDAIAHAMTTIATGGFSTSDDSLAAFATPGIEWIAVVFMILGSLPFVLYLQVVRGRPMSLFRDSQVRWFLALALALIIIVILILSISQGVSSSQSLRLAAFNTISILTGTGYSTAAFDNWGPLALTIFFLIMFIGGCAGSTTCGIKIFRFQILYETATTQIRRLVQPHGVFIPYYNRSPITDEVAMSVMSFFFFYVLVYVVLALGLSLLGLDFLTALSGAATAISNVGPGLGPVIGPNGTFTSLPDSAKWLLSAGMLLGRLELFTILVLFAPAFWKP
ncbi:MAG: TrkH family potassium uptake protein [Alphaproteobacteria bacterium]|nr:TrkH family potassium uptake protein [Alphaproteobacteria bacterium]MCZ6588643.1 TrkH family potassium uptake protein [Alphaproteobacteria bacterium]MCZ6590560.1 TrkH family potassium uptake protein [Alphaproteobacteria bacterium]MCZ6838173.1 TrkH family potassium uptake protein [Alphaproteobacteria bacterium]